MKNAILKAILVLLLCGWQPTLLPADAGADAESGPGAEPGPAVETPAAEPQFLQLSGQARLKMVTIFPGEALYSMFGHTAIRIEDPLHEIDLLYNYGQSSVPFDASFVPRFVTGNLPFMLGVVQSARAYDFYRNYENRTIYEQDLLLNREERQKVFEYLEVNARPENRIYIYDFFHDNCTTRVRDLFWDIFGEEINFQLAERPAQPYRRAIRPYLSEKPFVKFGINLMLGSPTDGVPGRERRLYLPGQLMRAVAAAELNGRPLMGSERIVHEGRNGTTILPEDLSPLRPALAGLLLWGILLIVALLSIRRARNASRSSMGLRVLDAGLFAAAGAVGMASLLLWNYSGYVMTTANWHLLWAWPSHLIIAFLLLMKQRPSALRWYAACGGAAALVSLVLIPLAGQSLPGPVVPLLLLLGLRGLTVSGLLNPRLPGRCTARRTDSS
ncbi:MAG: DUF4105 domain-containing protein [bacterium]